MARQGSNAAPWVDDFVRVKPDDMTQVTAVAGIEEAARQVDDPDAFPPIAKMLAGQMRYGWDLDAPEHYLYIPEDASDPVGTLVLDLPTRDNLHLAWVGIVVHPDHRRHGHGSVIMNEALRLARRGGRSTIWVGTAEMIKARVALSKDSASGMPATMLADDRC